MLRFFTLALAALAFLGGCDAFGPSGAVRLEASAEAYRPGDEASVSLVNDSGAEVGFSFCLSLDLEARSGGRWVLAAENVGRLEDSACVMIRTGLSPGERAEGRARLPADLAPGTYRLATLVEVRDRYRRVASAAFEVR